MGSQVRVTIALESVYGTNGSFQASAIYFRVSAASGSVPTEPLTMAQPRHQLSLNSLHGQHAATGTSSTIPYAKLSLEHPRRIRSGVTGALLWCIEDKTAPLTMPCRHSSKLQDSSTPPPLAA